jgi:diguanylate cyclase (GGDEF)-like protein
MALHYDIWLILLSVIATSSAIFIAFGLIGALSQSSARLKKPLTLSQPLIVGTTFWASHLLAFYSTHTHLSFTFSWPLLLSWLFATIIAVCFMAVVVVLTPKLRHFIIGGLCAGICMFGLFYTSYIAINHDSIILLSLVMAIITTVIVVVAMIVMLMITYWLKNYSGKNNTPIKIVLAILISGILLSINFVFYSVFSEANPSLLPSEQGLTGFKITTIVTLLGLLSLLLTAFMFFLLYERYGKNVFKLAGAFRPISAYKFDKTNLSDPLTKLPNRRAFESHLRAAEKRHIRNGNAFAVAYIDLDAFKPINDTYGHHTGDRVLSMTADRLNAAIRGCDFVARIGGDEFVAILEEIHSEDDIRPVVSRIVTSIKEPYFIDHLNIELSCSVGIAIYPKDNQDNKLLVNADAAMYKAKDQGKNQFKFYDEEIESANILIQHMQRDLMMALQNKEFSIAYMPKINCKTMAAVGAEALIRWNHPTKGEILPNDFLGIAEQCGLIQEINAWVVDACCHTLVRARETGLDLNISINLSSYQFRDANLAQQIVRIIKNHALHPNCLSFEIKETAAINNQEQFKDLLSTFKEAGIKVILDDFGLLPVSLTYLLDLDIDEIKIDKSFIAMINKDDGAKALIDAVFKLTHALGFQVTAEGIEDKAQQETIIKLGCDFMQGYLFTKPVKEDELLVLYKKLQYKQLQIDFDMPIEPTQKP